MKILIADLAQKTFTQRPLEDPLVGGRLLTSKLVHELVDPKCDPLSAKNILVFACGPLAGHRTSTGSRLSVGCKSPLTGGIKEANAGGMAGDSIALLGYRAIVLTEKLPENETAILLIDDEGPRFADGKAYKGLGNEALVQKLFEDHGSDYAVISIGQAGEMLMKAAGVAVTDENDKPFRLAARGGVGAVMGSKGIKAIMLKRPDRKYTSSAGDEAKKAVTAFNKHVATSERVKVLRQYGTASTVMPVQTLGGLPVRNFSLGKLPDATPISGDTLHDVTKERGGVGTPTEGCMTGCVIQCSNVFPNKKGELAAAPVEFETIGLCGSNLEIVDLDEIAHINRLCNDFGLDTIEIGAALGVMMEAAEQENLPKGYNRAELPTFGDGKRAAEIINEIPQNTKLGNLLGNGAVAVGTALDVKHIPVAKGQAMSAYDPRVVKGTGVTYITSPQGADHTAGLTVFFPVDHTDPSNAVELSRKSQIQRAAYDALGLCAFNTSATGQFPEIVVEMLRKIYDMDLPEGWMDTWGRKVIDTELAFNKAAGFTNQDDRVPEYFTTEPVPSTNTVFDVPEAELDSMWA